MPVFSTPALINGINFSWQNAKIVLFNLPLIGITKIKLNEEQEKANNYGSGSLPISRGYGRISYDCSMTVYWDEIAPIINASPGRKIINIPPFDFSMVLTSTRQPTQVIKVRMAEFTKTPFEVNEGATKIEVECPMIIGGIDW